MIPNQYDDSADNRDEHAPQIEAGYPGAAKMLEQPAADHTPDNSKQDIEEETLSPTLYYLAGDEARDQSEDDPAED